MPNPLASTEPWNLVSAGYADYALAIMRPFSQRALELAAQPRNARIVDVAAGPGTLSLLAAPMVSDVQAVDFSTAMLDRLANEAQAAGLTNITAQLGDGQALPFDDNRFDAAFSMFGLMFFPDRAKGFRELSRVLRPGGTAVVSSWAPAVESPMTMLMFGALRAANPTIPEPERDVLSLENTEVFEAEMRAAGFTDVVIHRHTAALSYDSPEQLWERMSASAAPLVMMRKGMGEAAWATQADAMLSYVRENYRAGESVSATALLGTGIAK